MDYKLYINPFAGSVFDLADMVRASNPRSLLEYIGYGNYCGYGGKGIPRDDIDE